jgi:hypothetical protein
VEIDAVSVEQSPEDIRAPHAVAAVDSQRGQRWNPVIARPVMDLTTDHSEEGGDESNDPIHGLLRL